MTPARVAKAGLACAAVLACAAPWLAPFRAGEQLDDRAFAPPTPIHVWDAGVRAPFIRPLVLEDRLRARFAEDTSARVPVRVSPPLRLTTSRADQPLLLLGADPIGRDVFSRLLLGARWSLGVTAFGTFGALVIGALVGGIAALAGGALERWLMRVADFVLVLPAVYLVLALRASLPLVLSTGEVFALMSTLFALAAWPHVARGVRAIVAVERAKDYVEAARAAGAGSLRVLRHVLPAARPFLLAEIVLLVPALLSAEAAISFLGLGFPEPTPSWGTMLQDAANVRVMTDAPWMLAPAVALFAIVLAVQIAGSGASTRAIFFDSLANDADPS